MYPQDPDTWFDTENLLYDSAREILRHEDRQQYLQWLMGNIDQYVDAPEDLEGSLQQEHLNAMAVALGCSIWNAMPLPGNDYRPAPVPLPKRNSPCPCGSGRKYKQCCLVPYSGPELDAEALWAILLEVLPAGSIDQAVAGGKIPLSALSVLALDYLEEGKPKKAAALLEPFFSGNIARTGRDADEALTLLIDCYDELDFHIKKQKLLEHVTAKAKKSPLRAGAWQRIVAIRIDDDDQEGAWEAFHHARRDNPDDPALGVLEITLLLAERKPDQARQRADFWLRRARKLGYDHEDSPVYSFFSAASEDPLALMAEIGRDIADGAGEELSAWLDQVYEMPVPVYTISRHRDPETEQRIPPLTGRQLSLPFVSDEPAAEPEPFDEEEEEMWLLEPPPEIADLEGEWHQLFPLDKPFSIHSIPFGNDDPWNYEIEEKWSEFLHDNHEAFDSIDILDDLAAALDMKPELAAGWAYDNLVEPILLRSRDILQRAVDEMDEPVALSWLLEANRPALRNLARLVWFYHGTGREGEALKTATWLLQLNPDDNHGFRSMVVNFLLRQGRDIEALALAERFPGDVLPDTMLGRVLALSRLGREEEAKQALAAAMERHVQTVRSLWRERVKKPAIDEHGVTIGGRDQAWIYREAMRDVWAAQPGLLDWLKKESKNIENSGS